MLTDQGGNADAATRGEPKGPGHAGRGVLHSARTAMLQQALQLAKAAKRDMPNAYKAAVRMVPNPIRRRLYDAYFVSKISGLADAQTIFEAIHDGNLWNSMESRSGAGSDLTATQYVRPGLEDWLQRHRTEIAAFLDAPCGDFHWMSSVAFPDQIKYVGGEIVRALVAQNNDKYHSDRRSFVDLDIVKGPLPQTDAWFCRDALIHLPFAAGVAAVENFRRSNARYFLSTTFPQTDNANDIPCGHFHPVNLAMAPFDLGEPLEMIRDAADGDRCIGVWQNPSR